MDTSNLSFLLLVGFLAISIIVVAMLPLDACRPDPPTGGNEPNPDRNRTEPTAPTHRLELASLYLRDLEARNWEKLSICLAATTSPAQLASEDICRPLKIPSEKHLGTVGEKPPWGKARVVLTRPPQNGARFPGA